MRELHIFKLNPRLLERMARKTLDLACFRELIEYVADEAVALVRRHLRLCEMRGDALDGQKAGNDARDHGRSYMKSERYFRREPELGSTHRWK